MKRSNRFTALVLAGTMFFGGLQLASVHAEDKKAAAECEALYAEWQGSGDYAAYYKTAADTEYTKADGALVRNDGSGNYCLQLLGLRGGVEYTIRTVPVKNGVEDESGAQVFTGTPKSFDRSGYAHFNTDNNPGAYYANGTLPENADVVYINDGNVDSVSYAFENGKKLTGLAKILEQHRNSEKPLVIRFIGKVNIPSSASGDRMIEVKESKAGLTIEGVGCDSGLYGWGLKLSACEDVEIRNLHFDWYYEDGIENRNSKHIWIHDNTFTVGNQDPPKESDKAHGDGTCDVVSCDYMTISYNHCIGTAKTHLVGNNANKQEETGNLSFHHNFFDGTEQRTPRFRWHNGHVYNNYYKSAGYDLDDGSLKGYGVGATCKCNIFAENNYFENTYRPLLTSDASEGDLSKNDGGVIKAFGNVFDNCTGMKEKDCFLASDKYQVLTPQDYTASKGGATYNNFDTSNGFYKDAYFLQSANEAKQLVEIRAGAPTVCTLALTNDINGDVVTKGTSTDDSPNPTEDITENIQPDPTTEVTTETTSETTTETSTETSTETTTETVSEQTTENADVNGLWGDADDDGYIMAVDSAYILQHTLDPKTLGFTEEKLARLDVDGKNGVNAADAAQVLQKVLLSTYKFPVEER